MEGDEFEGMGFNPSEFFSYLRKSASVKAGAIMFGQAQVAYYEVLKESMSEEEAFNLMAHSTECIVRGMFAAVGPLADVALRAATLAELFGKQQEKSDKKVPGE
jgi:hypothetical protein